jgi:hypothetical protein
MELPVLTNGSNRHTNWCVSHLGVDIACFHTFALLVHPKPPVAFSIEDQFDQASTDPPKRILCKGRHDSVVPFSPAMRLLSLPPAEQTCSALSKFHGLPQKLRFLAFRMEDGVVGRSLSTLIASCLFKPQLDGVGRWLLLLFLKEQYLIDATVVGNFRS